MLEAKQQWSQSKTYFIRNLFYSLAHVCSFKPLLFLHIWACSKTFSVLRISKLILNPRLLNVDTCDNGEGQGIDQEEHSFQPRCNHCPILHDDATPLVRRKVGWLMEGGAVWRVKKDTVSGQYHNCTVFHLKKSIFQWFSEKIRLYLCFIPAAQRHGLVKG